MSPAVYVQTNNATENEVIVFGRAEDGSLALMGSWSKGGGGRSLSNLI